MSSDELPENGNRPSAPKRRQPSQPESILPPPDAKRLRHNVPGDFAQVFENQKSFSYKHSDSLPVNLACTTDINWYFQQSTVLRDIDNFPFEKEHESIDDLLNDVPVIMKTELELIAKDDDNTDVAVAKRSVLGVLLSRSQKISSELREFANKLRMREIENIRQNPRVKSAYIRKIKISTGRARARNTLLAC